MKKISLILILIISLLSLAFLTFSCDTTEPNKANITLKFEDASCTEAWIRLNSSYIATPTNFIVYLNDKNKYNFTINSTDTIIYIDSLQPNQTYDTFATLENELGLSNKIQFTTLDTTSHNFTWQTFTFGEHSSVLYDVAIINENNIWAVGEIYMKDSLGNPDPTFYNAVHWNGQSWELKKIYYKGGIWTIRTIFAFNENDIWFSGYMRYLNGQFTELPIPNILMGWSINKLWGSSSNDLYAVGDGGNIAHYQNGVWKKIESGTDVNLKDIYGTPDGKNVWISGYQDFKPTVLLKISNSIIETVFNTRDYLYVNSPDHISGGIESVWTNNNNFVYVTTWYGLYRKSIYLDPSREEYLSRSGRGRPSSLDWRGIRSRATDINNIFTSGYRGTVHHFNGVTYRTYSELANNGVTYYSLDVKENLSVLCGQKFENGINDKAIITLTK